VSIASTGVALGFNRLVQLAEKNNDLTTVTINGSEKFSLVFLLSMATPATV
jgi:hypothetical protein